MHHKVNNLTADEQIAIIEKMAIKSLMAGLLYLRDELYRDEPMEDDVPYTLLSAFDDVFDRIDALDSYDRKQQYSQGYLENVRDIAIAIGWYQEITEDELSRRISTGKKYAFKHKNKKYEFISRGK